jgi:hypothetical protein
MLFDGHNRSQHCRRDRTAAKRDVSIRWSVCAWQYDERLAIEIEPDGAIRHVIHNHPNRAAERGKRIGILPDLLPNSASFRRTPASA